MCEGGQDAGVSENKTECLSTLYSETGMQIDFAKSIFRDDRLRCAKKRMIQQTMILKVV